MFDFNSVIVDHVGMTPQRGAYPDACSEVLSRSLMDDAFAEITSWPGYQVTPMRGLTKLSKELGIDELLYKDEAGRFGLGSFKAPGGAYAVMRVVATEIAERTGEIPSLESIRNSEWADEVSKITITSATAGNHGRAVVWGARLAGATCRIYIHAGVSDGRKVALEELGAEVVRTSGDYDDSVRQCFDDAQANGWNVVSDTSFEGYMDVPRYVMAGYGVFAHETFKIIENRPSTHVFVQAGVGGLAAALMASLWQKLGDRCPRFVIVEPARAACVLASVREGAPTSVQVTEESSMAGLSCGEVSRLAWEVLSRGTSDVLAVSEEHVGDVMRLLAAGETGGGKLVAGESAVAGLLALIAAAKQSEWRMKLGLDSRSRVLVIGCEGATDPEIYEQIVGSPAPG